MKIKAGCLLWTKLYRAFTTRCSRRVLPVGPCSWEQESIKSKQPDADITNWNHQRVILCSLPYQRVILSDELSSAVCPIIELSSAVCPSNELSSATSYPMQSALSSSYPLQSAPTTSGKWLSTNWCKPYALPTEASCASSYCVQSELLMFYNILPRVILRKGAGKRGMLIVCIACIIWGCCFCLMHIRLLFVFSFYPCFASIAVVVDWALRMNILTELMTFAVESVFGSACSWGHNYLLLSLFNL